MFDRTKNMFLQSNKKLLSDNVTEDDMIKATNRVKIVEASFPGVPDKNMNLSPGYVNKLFTLQSDLTQNLCQKQRTFTAQSK